MKKLQKGFALTELLIAVAVVALIFAAIFSVYTQLTATTDGSTLASQITAIQSTTREQFGRQRGRYATVAAEHIANSQRAPADMITGLTPNGLVHVFGGDVEINPVAYSGVAGTGFEILISGVPADACSAVLSRVEGMFGFIAVGSPAPAFSRTANVGGGVVKNMIVGDPMDQVLVINACNSSGLSDLRLATN